MLIYKIGFAPVVTAPVGSSPGQLFYATFAIAAAVFFACAVVCGFYGSIALGKAITAKWGSSPLGPDQSHELRELLVASATAAVGLIGSIATALLGLKT